MTAKYIRRVAPLLSLLFVQFIVLAQAPNPGHRIATQNGVYSYNSTQTPSTIIEVTPPFLSGSGLSYQWQRSLTADFSSYTIVATTSSCVFSGPVTQTAYFRRVTTQSVIFQSVSNIVKISLVSIGWEDRNYLREHDVITAANTTWQAVDQLAIGQKLQTTEYFDGLGRTVQKISKGTATPASGNNWGDIVQFSEYDVYGREVKKYLPFTAGTQTGTYRTSPAPEQTTYFNNNYGETSPFSKITFDNSPLSRVTKINEAGTSWSVSAGKRADYETNVAADSVRLFIAPLATGVAPNYIGAYSPGQLYKSVYTDEEGKRVIEYINIAGQLVLKKVQLEDNPTTGHAGWICTYNVYDDFGRLRQQLQPEAVKYLLQNNWSFSGTNGEQVLNGLCFQYAYDNKGRTIWKKAPGAGSLYMIYDSRDRLVFTQDSNQAALTIPQWTFTVYDELDRPVITALYNTTSNRAALQLLLDNAQQTTSFSILNGIIPIYIFNASLCPLSQNTINTSSSVTRVKYQFYDGYSFAGVRTFNTAFTNTAAYTTSDPMVKSGRTLSLPTGTATRVLGTATFLTSTYFYDEKGRQLQTQLENIKSGVDITTLQYAFDGRLLSTCNSHTATNTGYNNFITLTKNVYDKLGRLTSIQKQYGSNAFKTVSNYVYDDVGRLKTKVLSPGYSAGGNSNLESLDYSYNIHNQITGINKDYALKDVLTYNKWAHFFGQYLGFDNRDNVFSNAKLNGQVTGVLWTTMGDDMQRKYDFGYDNAGRLTKALFNERKQPGSTWSNATMDYSVTGSSGQISYDLNGNLLSMLQKGVLPGQAAPFAIDNLSYSYAQFSNKLLSVTDAATPPIGGAGGGLGDFKDGANGSNPDYVYDGNGNVVVDLNKNAKELGSVAGANGIKYNYLDKPEEIRIAGKGTIKIVYSADGEKLQRIFTPDGGGTASATTTTYIGSFIYKGDVLQHINFEEGRVRVVTPASQNNGNDVLTIAGNITLPVGAGVYDYFVLDYQKNVRMVITEGVHAAANTCTMETSRSAVETSIFGNEVNATRYSKTSQEWKGYSSPAVCRLGNTSGNTLGPNVLQKVLAGDKITASVMYWHNNSSVTYTSNNFLSTLVNTMMQTLSGSMGSGIVKENTTAINSELLNNSAFTSAVQAGSTTSTSTPLAYLTVLFFDERFRLVEDNGGVYRQQVLSSVPNAGEKLNIPNVRAPKNGYVYVYISNRSNQPVLFDNLQVSYNAGNLIEENHYYSYGLKIAAISSKKLPHANEGTVKNNYQYQGEYSEMDDDIGWNDFALRNYDPQIGRWVQQDPFQEFASPYIGMGNDPVNNVDPSGGNILGGLTQIGKTAVTTLGGMIIGGAIDLMTGGDGSTGMMIGAAVGALGSLSYNLATASRAAIQTASAASRIINTAISSSAVGRQVTAENVSRINSSISTVRYSNYPGSSVIRTPPQETSTTNMPAPQVQRTQIQPVRRQQSASINHDVLNSPVGNAIVTSEFRVNRTVGSRIHLGTDYAVPEGTPVHATAAGIVVRSDRSTSYGNVVIIDHGASADGLGSVYTLYAHGSRRMVNVGNQVRPGQNILLSGNTGHSTGPHLHYEVIRTRLTPTARGFYGNINIRFGPRDLRTLLPSQ